MTTLTYSSQLVTTSCWCGIHVAIPVELYDEAQRSGKGVYCPLGHSFVYRNTTKEQLERALKRETAVRDLLAAEERSHAATRGHLTRTKKRIANGVCPCCHRHFANVERHMANKHPDYAPA